MINESLIKKNGGTNMKSVVLFDMDGTLTPPRMKMDPSMIYPLVNLQSSGFEIAIVSGSDMDYIKEQCEIMLDINALDPEKIYFLPCNGTKYFKFQNSKFENVYEKNMKSELGKEKYRSVIYQLFESQKAARYCLGGNNIPLSGTFIQYRGSTINWCPIGRDATTEERKEWVELDKKHKIRESLLRRIKSIPVFKELEIKLGGETSFDIYPKGWNKTFSWKLFKDYEKIYFVGDKCKENGNDYEAFIMAAENGYETMGPENTKEIIKKIIEENNTA